MKQSFDRWVVLEPNQATVPVKAILGLVSKACEIQYAGVYDDRAEEAAFSFGFKYAEDDELERAIRELRDAGRIKVYEPGGLGQVRDDDVMRGELQRDHLAILLEEEFQAGLIDGAAKGQPEALVVGAVGVASAAASVRAKGNSYLTTEIDASVGPREATETQAEWFELPAKVRSLQAELLEWRSLRAITVDDKDRKDQMVADLIGKIDSVRQRLERGDFFEHPVEAALLRELPQVGRAGPGVSGAVVATDVEAIAPKSDAELAPAQPGSAAPGGSTEFTLRSERWCQLILRKLRDLKLTPDDLPPFARGARDSIKKTIRTALANEVSSDDAFNHAWKQLMRDARIKYRSPGSAPDK